MTSGPLLLPLFVLLLFVITVIVSASFLSSSSYFSLLQRFTPSLFLFYSPITRDSFVSFPNSSNLVHPISFELSISFVYLSFHASIFPSRLAVSFAFYIPLRSS